MFDDEKVEFNLLYNAIDSIERAIELVAWSEEPREERRLKQAILSIAHGIELLLKERLRRVHPALLWENVDKYPSSAARTVTAEGAMLRLANIGGVRLHDGDVRLIRSLRDTRNSIEHYAWSLSKDGANEIVGRALAFAIHFASNQLTFDIIGYDGQKNDLVGQLLARSRGFAKAQEERSETDDPTDSAERTICDFCKAQTVNPNNGECRLCGHWNDIDRVLPSF